MSTEEDEAIEAIEAATRAAAAEAFAEYEAREHAARATTSGRAAEPLRGAARLEHELDPFADATPIAPFTTAEAVPRTPFDEATPLGAAVTAEVSPAALAARSVSVSLDDAAPTASSGPAGAGPGLGVRRRVAAVATQVRTVDPEARLTTWLEQARRTDYYSLLGLTPRATHGTVLRAHERAVATLAELPPSAAVEAARELLDEALAVLSDPATRATYARHVGTQPPLVVFW